MPRQVRPGTLHTLMRMPSCAPTPVPTMTAVGVARPSAQGHEMTITLMPNSEAKRPNPWPCGSQAAGYRPHTPAQYLRGVSGGVLAFANLNHHVMVIVHLITQPRNQIHPTNQPTKFFSIGSSDIQMQKRRYVCSVVTALPQHNSTASPVKCGHGIESAALRMGRH